MLAMAERGAAGPTVINPPPSGVDIREDVVTVGLLAMKQVVEEPLAGM